MHGCIYYVNKSLVTLLFDKVYDLYMVAMYACSMAKPGISVRDIRLGKGSLNKLVLKLVVLHLATINLSFPAYTRAARPTKAQLESCFFFLSAFLWFIYLVSAIYGK